MEACADCFSSRPRIFVYIGPGGEFQLGIFDGATGNYVNWFPGSNPSETFARSVAVASGGVLAGSPGEAFHGAAYLINGFTGTLIRTFQNPAQSPANGFGFSVAMSDNRVLIGAPAHSNVGSRAGSAFFYDRQTGQLKWVFNPTAPRDLSYFGTTVAMDNNDIAIGTFSRNPLTGEPGEANVRVYHFNHAGTLLHTLTSPTAGESFALSLSVSGGYLLVGAGGLFNQTPLLYDAATGQLIKTFTRPIGDSGFFGYSATLGNGFALITSPALFTSSAGNAYLYEVPSGNLVRTFSPANDPGVAENSPLAFGSVGNNHVALWGLKNKFYYFRGPVPEPPNSVAGWMNYE